MALPPLVRTFWVSVLAGTHPQKPCQRGFFFYFDFCLRSRGLSDADSHRLFCERTASYDSYTGTLAAAAACVSSSGRVRLKFHFDWFCVIVIGLPHDFPVEFGDGLRHSFPRPSQGEIASTGNVLVGGLDKKMCKTKRAISRT